MPWATDLINFTPKLFPIHQTKLLSRLSLTSHKLHRRQWIAVQSDKEMLRHQFVVIEHYSFSREAKGKNFISSNNLIQSYPIDFEGVFRKVFFYVFFACRSTLQFHNNLAMWRKPFSIIWGVRGWRKSLFSASWDNHSILSKIAEINIASKCFIKLLSRFALDNHEDCKSLSVNPRILLHRKAWDVPPPACKLIQF